MTLTQTRADETDLSHYLADAEKAVMLGKSPDLSIKSFVKGWKPRFGQQIIEDLVIPHRTFLRRKLKKENLSPNETDKAMRLARISIHAERVFHSRERADHWMSTPNPKFSGQTPFAMMKTEMGCRMVDETLYQIQHGIFA